MCNNVTNWRHQLYVRMLWLNCLQLIKTLKQNMQVFFLLKIISIVSIVASIQRFTVVSNQIISILLICQRKCGDRIEPNKRQTKSQLEFHVISHFMDHKYFYVLHNRMAFSHIMKSLCMRSKRRIRL